MLKKKAIGAFVAAATLLSGFAFASLPPVALASTGSGDTNQTVHSDSDVIQFKSENFKIVSLSSMGNAHAIKKDGVITYGEARAFAGDLDLGWDSLDLFRENRVVSNISDLQYFPNVTSVELGEFNNVSDFSPLSHLKNLTSLEISLYNGKKDLSTLPQMDSVKHFTLHASRLFPKVSNRISDFSFISKMPNLETLDLGGDISVSNLNFLSGLKNLKKIIVRNIPSSLSDLTPLRNMKDLEEVSIGSSEVSDLSPLSKLTKLTNLSIGATDKVTSLNGISNLTDLTNLCINGSKISDLSPLSKLTKLTDLIIRTDGKVTSLNGISNLTDLTGFCITNTELSDLSPLSKLTKLTDLRIDTTDKVTSLKDISNLTSLINLEINGDSKVSDLSPLQSMVNLQYLSIWSSELSNLSPLQNLTGLVSLYIYAPKVKNIDTLSGLKKLRTLDIRCCDDITDYSPLKVLKSGALFINEKAKNNAVIKYLKGNTPVHIKSEKCHIACSTKPVNPNPPAPNPPAPAPNPPAPAPNPPAPNPPAPNPPAPNPPAPNPPAPDPDEYRNSNGSGDSDWNLFDPDEPDDFDNLLNSLNSNGSGDSVSNTVSDSSTSSLGSQTPALDDNIDFSEMLDLADFDVDALSDLSDFGNINVGDFVGTDSVDNSGDAGIPSGVDDFNIYDFNIDDFDFADLLDYLGDLDLDDLAPADVADADSSVPAVPVGVVNR